MMALLVISILCGCTRTVDPQSAAVPQSTPAVSPPASELQVPAEVPRETGEFVSEAWSAPTVDSSEENAEPISALTLDDSSPSIDATGKPPLQLRADLTPDKLVEFLSASDQDMQLIYSGRSGITDQDQAMAEMQRLIRGKLVASRRLIDHAEATDAERSIGKRGELQALSHLASSGNVKAAEELETIATEGLRSNDASVVSDSQLVLLGFAIESLQNGDDSAAPRIAELVQQYATAQTSPDVPAMMVMGQAREMLSKYGHVEEARSVREKLLESFADSADPDVAMMAAKLAGAVRYDGVDKLRASATNGKAVSPQDWKHAAQTLVDESRDLLTVQYLATAALELEGAGNRELSDVTYDVLKENFSEGSDALSREVSAAIKAHAARQDVIGKPFDNKLSSLEGETIEMSDYIGRIVLMPFWVAEYPASLQLLPNINELRKQHPNDIAIVGVNLDAKTTTQATGAREKLGFPNLHSQTNPDAAAPNPLASRFGMVSLPFLVILDRQGNVADICFTERQLALAIDKLMVAN